jgi:hypothetical protein
MGAMIEQIRVGKTSTTGRAAELVRQMWIRSADHHPGPRLLDAPQDEA